MLLSEKMGGYFTQSVQYKGEDYLTNGRVRIHHGSKDEVDAVVRGSKEYEVNIYCENNALTAWCECPYFGSEGPCKHLWATMLAAEARGFLSSAASLRNPKLHLENYDSEDDLAELDTEEFSLRHPQVIQWPAAKPANWKKQIDDISELSSGAATLSRPWPAKKEVIYIVDVSASLNSGNLILQMKSSQRKADGAWTRGSSLPFRRSEIAKLPLAEDREIVSTVIGGSQYYEYGNGYGYGYDDRIPDSCVVPVPLTERVVRLATQTERCFYRSKKGADDLAALTWDGDGAWRFGLEIRKVDGGGLTVDGFLRREDKRMKLQEPVLVTRGGLVFTRDRVACVAADTPFDWLFHLRKAGPIVAPEKDEETLMATLLAVPGLPAPEVPDELRYEEVTLAPRPGIKIRKAKTYFGGEGKLQGELFFAYGGHQASAHDKAQGFFQAADRRFLRRDWEAEGAAVRMLSEMGLKYRNPTYQEKTGGWHVPPTKLPRVVRTLMEAGWHIEAEGKVFRRPGAFNIEVSSGVDWFELHGQVEYGETSARLPELLAAVQKGEEMVRLDDGTYGVLPEEWLRRIGVLAGMGTAKDGHMRFGRSQAGLLDALLASQPEARCDETFSRVREELRRFQGVEAAAQPAGFVGSLRDYQREGLGWMQFLNRFSFGGCLADDMGVGKTAQVLALLEASRERRAAGESIPPSLIVVPRSLVFNWKEEAARFTPQLRVFDYTGLGRNAAEFCSYDLVLTTYGTLRRDATILKDIEFEYVVLDEAQAVKNAQTDSAKAARLLRGRHRLALSGTPVENHLGELWSLFEFLNPGMLGKASVFNLAGGAMRNPDEETRQLLAHALRPFILRRTKAQVARELPAKTEQTIYCELKAAQRKLYDELRQHYRDSLLKRIESEGLGKSKIMVLEALLRLRQAACHPALIDVKRSGENSAKLETLMQQLGEVREEGHKALVFSQFTSLLRIVRDRLDADGIVYEYLDGSTRDRQAPVQRFQTDPACRLFLISLKAGGLGLNLTAAEYVFLLDPWWNPAVEAQAIDRTHRIGQTRQVFAYRLIARDTVEEKVLELQKTKRDLAAAIINADNSLIRDLGREDLELLLS